jgi:hypothetical protein
VLRCNLPEQPPSKFYFLASFPTLLFVRVYNALHIHIYPSVVQYTHSVTPFRNSLLFVPFATLRSFRSIFTLFILTQNAFLHKALSSIPHSRPRRRPASTSSERLVRSVYSRQMFLGRACRVWRLGVGEHSQSVLTYAKHVAFPYPSLTSHTYAYIVGPCQCDFGHYPRHWLANYDEMQPDQLKARYPADVQGQQSRL